MELVAKIAELVATNKASVNQMIDGIKAALEVGRANLTLLEEIENNTRGIDKVTGAIETVAIKTSMLAVNGAVEAARAGEYGKGFAVVSGDIQSLADDTADNIGQVKDLVKTIQDQAVNVRNDLSAVADNALREVENAKQTTIDLNTIEDEVKELLAGNKEIQQAAVEIAAGVIQAKKGMEQISVASEQASSNAQEAATASQQQSQGAEELAAAIEEIAAIADELQSV